MLFIPIVLQRSYRFIDSVSPTAVFGESVRTCCSNVARSRRLYSPPPRILWKLFSIVTFWISRWLSQIEEPASLTAIRKLRKPAAKDCLVSGSPSSLLDWLELLLRLNLRPGRSDCWVDGSRRTRWVPSLYRNRLWSFKSRRCLWQRKRLTTNTISCTLFKMTKMGTVSSSRKG